MIRQTPACSTVDFPPVNLIVIIDSSVNRYTLGLECFRNSMIKVHRPWRARYVGHTTAQSGSATFWPFVTREDTVGITLCAKVKCRDIALRSAD